MVQVKTCSTCSYGPLWAAMGHYGQLGRVPAALVCMARTLAHVAPNLFFSIPLAYYIGLALQDVL